MQSQLRISTDEADKATVQAIRFGCLTFSLAPIPEGATIAGAVVRVVGRNTGGGTQLVRIFLSDASCAPPGESAQSIGRWTARTNGPVWGEGPGLASAVSENLGAAEDKMIHLLFRSESRRTDWDYSGSPEESSQPRLLVTYTATEAPLPPTGDTTSWKFFRRDSVTADKKEILKARQIESGPYVYRDSVIVFAKPTDTERHLYALSTAGVIRWQRRLTEEPGAYSAIDARGKLYNFTRDEIRVYDLDRAGTILATYASPGEPARPPTVAPGGNVYYPGKQFLHALTPFDPGGVSLRQIWKFQDVGGGGTRVAVSPRGPDFRAYALGRRGLFVLDAATGLPDAMDDTWSGTSVYDPVVGAKDNDIAAVAAGGGELAAYSNGRRSWSEAGPVGAQPIVTADRQGLATVLDGRFARLKLPRQFGSDPQIACLGEQAFGPTPISNLLLDGDSTAYFLTADGVLHGFDADCNRVLHQGGAGVSDPLLRFAHDGTLIARFGDTLYALNRRAGEDLRITEWSDRTLYSGTTIRAGGTLEKEKSVLLRGERRIAFEKGFRVKAGSLLTCQIQ